jgi:RNA polymerase sigma-70 factor (ECF subfamily)
MKIETDARLGRSDADLVVRARTDRDAFGQLYDVYYPRIFRHCLRRLFLRCVAEDITSDVFLRIAGQMRDFAGTTHDDFIRWAHAITTNVINAYLRQNQRRSRLLEEATRQKAACDADRVASSASLSTLDWPRVYESLLDLDLRDQAIVTLRFFEDMSHDRIASILDMYPGAVRTALSRALEKLRRILRVPS